VFLTKLSVRPLFLLAAIGISAASSAHGSGLVFNVTFDSSVASAPTGFTAAFNDAIVMYQSLFTNPITINMNVGWGEIDGGSISPGDLGESRTNQQGFFSYSQIKTALVNNATSPAQLQATGTLPATDPLTGSNNFVMSNAEAKALGLLAGNATGIDGWVGFDSAASWTFDPNNRAVPGEDDFIGIALHEISEVMGRYGLGQNGAASGRFSPIDLYRWTSPGIRDTSPENGDYFSIDNGTTNINTYNGPNGGDLSDWAGNTIDSYNAFLNTNTRYNISAGDVTLMNVLGYTLATPEPSSTALFGAGFIALLLAGRYTRNRNSGRLN
jgi:hypothetical protein